ncbi:hypothetical protein F4808DRAFT_428770 [Astrocystis sublimbata]|nr:hypothetical protein F4808DRAFT_428770 [Astrocystis sublimbata]
MASKRDYSEYSTDPSGAGEAHEHAPNYQNAKHKKRKGPSTEKPSSVNWLKKRARTIERRLNREEDSLPANVRHELEKELDHHKQKLDHLVDGKKRSTMITKYHMVRFFERKKADRLARQIRTQLKSVTGEEERERLQADLHIAEVDALYAKHFPYREPYISLYPVSSKTDDAKAGDASAAQRSLRTERPPVWDTIEKASQEGVRALVKIQERKSVADAKNQASEEKVGRSRSRNSSALESTGRHTANSKHRQAPEAQDSGGNDDDESDGGFFEEG